MSRLHLTSWQRTRLRRQLAETLFGGSEREERYVQVGRGTWRVIFIKGGEAPRRLTKARAEALRRQLLTRGVTEATATELIARFPTERIAVKIEVFDWLRENGKEKLFRNAPGYLVKSIEEDYAPP